jgi:hypothetical protein
MRPIKNERIGIGYNERIYHRYYEEYLSPTRLFLTNCRFSSLRDQRTSLRFVIINPYLNYSTVTLLAKFLGLSTSVPFNNAT